VAIDRVRHLRYLRHLGHVVHAHDIDAGVPARVLRYRFDEATRNELIASEWWTLAPSQLKSIAAEVLHELSPLTVAAFRDAVQATRERLI
jgi:hypothetical protein